MSPRRRPAAGCPSAQRDGGRIGVSRRGWFIVPAAFLLAFVVDAGAAPAPIVRTRIAPAAVTIGQPVTLTVDVLVPTWFGGAIEYPAALAVPDAVAKLSDERVVNLNERVGGDNYAGMSRNYVIVPQKAGAFDVPAVTLRVPYAVDGKTVFADLKTTPQHFDARLPAGAADLGYFISTHSYRLTQDVAPALANLKVGDAVTRTIAQRATDLAPMFLPALRFEPVDGLELYPAEPVLSEQRGERGAAAVATRVDAVTYVLAKPGRYRLPGVSIGWFDPGRAAMRRAEVPELIFDVAPAPAGVANAAATAPQRSRAPPSLVERVAGSWRYAVAGVSLLVLTTLAWRWLLPGVRRRLGERRARRAASEAVAFRRLDAAAREGDPAAVRCAATAWVARVADGEETTLAAFVSRNGDDRLATQLATLDRLLYGTSAENRLALSLPAFVQGLAAARQLRSRALRATGTRRGVIAPLNPGASVRPR